MKKLHKIPTLSVLTIFSFLFLVLYPPTLSSALSPSTYLGNALHFAVLANTPSVTNTGTTTISGTAGNDVGIAPAASFTGAASVTMTGGTVHLNDTAAQNAQTSLAAAYTTLSTLTTTKPDPGVELGGQTLTAGVYAKTTFGITTTLTLDGGGDPNAIFVFQSGSTLITADGGASKVVLTNQAQACNVYWTVGSAATLGTNSTFVGHVLSVASVTAKTGANITGQLLSRDAAVTLDSNVITNNNCATPTPTPTVSATPTSPCISAITTLVFATGGPGATTGKLTWVASGPGLFQFVGDPTLYPAGYNYGTMTSSWDGSLVNMVPTTTYPVAVRFQATCGRVSEASTVASNAAAAAVATPTPTPTPVVTPTPTPTPSSIVTPTPTPTPTLPPVETPAPTPPATEVAGQLPKTSTPWYNVLVGGVLLILIGATGWTLRRA